MQRTAHLDMRPNPFAGMLVGSNVRLKHLQGSGGMGSIWAAEHLGLEVDVAVKFLSPELISHEEARTRFEREAAAAAQLKSPHVVHVHDRGVTDQGLPYIVMELLHGEDLAKHIERLGPRPLAEVVAIFAQMGRALAAAHARGIVHRDIKPENVFLLDGDDGPFVKLLDFGIAKRPTTTSLSVTGENRMIGTPHFMSPEQLVSPREVDFRTDLWSAAVVAYVALTTRLPFDGETLGAICLAIDSGSYRAVTSLRPELPAALDDWFRTAFQRRPDQRFDSIQRMTLALEQASELSALRSRVAISAGPSSNADAGTPPMPVAPSSLAPPATPTPWSSALGEQQASSRGDRNTGRSEWLTALIIVLVSMLVSAFTTFLFMLPPGGLSSSPTSGRVSATVDGSEDTLDTSESEPVPADDPASRDPVVAPAAEQSVGIHANKPDRLDRTGPTRSESAENASEPEFEPAVAPAEFELEAEPQPHDTGDDPEPSTDPDSEHTLPRDGTSLPDPEPSGPPVTNTDVPDYGL